MTSLQTEKYPAAWAYIKYSKFRRLRTLSQIRILRKLGILGEFSESDGRRISESEMRGENLLSHV